MRRALLPPLTILLAVATAVALVGAAIALPVPPLVVVERPHDAGLVRRFYAAANTLLASGDAAPIEDLVAVDVVEHPQRLGQAAGRDGLVASLRSLRASAPGLRLIVDGVYEGDAGIVTAVTHAAGANDGSFLGLPVPPDLASWGSLEVVRVADGRIAEHWSGRAEAARFEGLLAVSVHDLGGQEPLPAEASRATAADDDRVDLAIEDVTLTPGARWPLPADGGRRVLVVEAGELALLTGAARDLAHPGKLLVAPDRLPANLPVAAGSATLAVPVDAPGETAVLVVSFVPSNSRDPTAHAVGGASRPAATGPGQAGVVRRRLVAAFAIRIPPDTRLALGRASFGPGQGLGCAAATGSVLLAVESGAVGVATTAGAAVVTRGGAGVSPGDPRSQKTLVAGDGAWLECDGGWWQARGPAPATLLILTLSAHAGGRMAGATPNRRWGRIPGPRRHRSNTALRSATKHLKSTATKRVK
jgi:hypothetical protein